MRLINTSTHLLSDFFDSRIPRYAILSHTWGDEEVSYHEWIYLYNQNIARWGWTRVEDEVDRIKRKSGYAKIMSVCKLAKTNGFEWVWVDTNCIDKSSSAELSEAINSMYNWYKTAQVCYAYLSDVWLSPDGQISADVLEKSRWFTRGWTLQELIAPRNLEFCDAEWGQIESSYWLQCEIESITGIPRAVLVDRNREDGHDPLAEYSIAQRMSWASRRQTTRREDMAYSLLGIFDVNMPLLYGEGDKAFRRLQEEIMRRHRDLTILTWATNLPFTSEGGETYSALALHPYQFSNCARIGLLSPIVPDTKEEPPAISCFGISVSVLLMETLSARLVFGVLNTSLCKVPWSRRRNPEEPWIMIPLVSEDKASREYHRTDFPGCRLNFWPVHLERGKIVTGNTDATAVEKIYLAITQPRPTPFAQYLQEDGRRTYDICHVLPCFPLGRRHFRILRGLDSSSAEADGSPGSFSVKADGSLAMGWLRRPTGDIAHGLYQVSDSPPNEPTSVLGMFFAIKFDQVGKPTDWTCQLYPDMDMPDESSWLAKSKSIAETVESWSHNIDTEGCYVTLSDEVYKGAHQTRIDTFRWAIVAYIFCGRPKRS